MTEKSSSWASDEKISIRQGIRSFVPCIVKGINNHMFQSTQMGLPGSLDCWRCAAWPRPGLKAWLCFHLSLVIIIIIFLHRTFYTWTSAPGMQQLAELISREMWSPILFISFSLPNYNLFIVLTGFLRIWWNHKHRTEHCFQNRKIGKSGEILQSLLQRRRNFCLIQLHQDAGKAILPLLFVNAPRPFYSIFGIEWQWLQKRNEKSSG